MEKTNFIYIFDIYVIYILQKYMEANPIYTT